ncbi:hypothetical protein [Winogradskya humida]|uniref:MarR family transcriptional regulator n=1 Tax=Winogradskya humida TaxID=113566 RepID=A0ABQ3ZGP0_9ACTN|nr:hypothetical protein [Actinoplanes humidus]GIE17741.1 hypothetical protein Ahu01nite_008430 [Actinoplanes humidus]
MPDATLTLIETCALLVLLEKAQEIANSELTKAGFKLDIKNREKLKELGLIEVRKEGQRIFLGISEAGWAKSLAAIGTEPPTGSGYRGVAVYSQVAALRQFLATSGLALSDFYLPQGEVAPDPQPATISAVDDVTAMVRKAYDGLAGTPGDAVKLVRLRAALPGIGRAELDAALIAMRSAPGVRVFSEVNQKTLTAADRAAAVSIGNQDKHLLAIT